MDPRDAALAEVVLKNMSVKHLGVEDCRNWGTHLTHGVQSHIDILGTRVYSGGMKIVFGDKRLALIRTDRAHELGLSFAVIKRAREKLHFLAEAPDERTLRSWKSLNYKYREGTNDQHQIRINDQYRIIFTIDNNATPPVITILEIGDPH